MIEAQTRPTTFASVAPAGQEDDSSPVMSGQDGAIHALCEDWVHWQRSRRLYAPKPFTGTILGSLSGGKMRPLHGDGPDAISCPFMAAFHLAWLCQPTEALDVRAFYLYYVVRIKPVKSAAAILGVSRQHFYTLVSACARRIAAAAEVIANDNQKQTLDLAARRAERAATGV